MNIKCKSARKTIIIIVISVFKPCWVGRWISYNSTDKKLFAILFWVGLRIVVVLKIRVQQNIVVIGRYYIIAEEFMHYETVKITYYVDDDMSYNTAM